MRTHGMTSAVQNGCDPRIVRSPGPTLEDMLLEEEYELRYRLQGEAETGVTKSIRNEVRMLESNG